ncbi:hypothetical protein KJ564_03140 [bacterium]|nr:hypothetical protein [bacterium]MBU1881082.1 hypothetical protein [bacterium]
MTGKKAITTLMVLLMVVWLIPSLAFCQVTQDTTQAQRDYTPSWGEGELIELDAVQIEGEIVQPNVIITVSRQEPQFKEIALERTPAEGLGVFDVTLPEAESFRAMKLRDWSEILARPRQ